MTDTSLRSASASICKPNCRIAEMSLPFFHMLCVVALDTPSGAGQAGRQGRLPAG